MKTNMHNIKMVVICVLGIGILSLVASEACNITTPVNCQSGSCTVSGNNGSINTPSQEPTCASGKPGQEVCSSTNDFSCTYTCHYTNTDSSTGDNTTTITMTNGAALHGNTCNG